MKTTVKSMAALWAKSHETEQVARLSTAISAPSSTTTLDEVPAESEGGTPRIQHAELPSSEYLGTTANQAGKFYLALRPGTPGTPRTPTGDNPEATESRVPFDEQLIEQLSAIEWRQENEEPQTIVSTCPPSPGKQDLITIILGTPYPSPSSGLRTTPAEEPIFTYHPRLHAACDPRCGAYA